MDGIMDIFAPLISIIHQHINIMTPGEKKKLIEKRLASVKKDLEENKKEYDGLNIAIRKYEIIKLLQRLLQFN